jgi:phenol hydroxylase P3 protein
MAKASMRERYAQLTRGLDWQPSYVTEDELYPYTKFEGIKIHDWDAWEDPFRLTVDAYCKYQSEKDKRLYAVLDSFAQGQGHLQATDARYINSLRLFLQGVTPLEYQAHRHFAYLARHLNGPGPRFASLCQSIDELRHNQTETHAISMYNKYYDGLHDPNRMHDRVWYLSVPKSFFDDGLSAGPFEFMTAISFSFEYFLTNLLFVPFMSGASFNGDLSTMSFGFSAQSDESRHMTLGLEVIKFLLEQHEDNLPIVQKWIDKWFWRGTRLLVIVAMMMDYMLPNKVMSWKEAWELYFEEGGGALFKDLARYGITMPKYAELTKTEKEHVSHQTWWTFYTHGHATGFHTWIPTDEEMDWLSEKYPDTFDKYYRPRWELAKEMEARGERFYTKALPQLCNTCQVPMLFTEVDDPTQICYRESIYNGDRYHFCSDGCKDIFDEEPEKYVQSWLPVHQIFQGNCGGPELEDILRDYYHMNVGTDNLDIKGSPDEVRWKKWKGVA